MSSIRPQSIYFSLQSRQISHDVSLRLLRRFSLRPCLTDLTKTRCVRSETVLTRSPHFTFSCSAPPRWRSRWCDAAAFMSLDAMAGSIGRGTNMRAAAFGEVAPRWWWYWFTFRHRTAWLGGGRCLNRRGALRWRHVGSS
jgi:hypothetical protein